MNRTCCAVLVALALTLMSAPAKGAVTQDSPIGSARAQCNVGQLNQCDDARRNCTSNVSGYSILMGGGTTVLCTALGFSPIPVAGVICALYFGTTQIALVWGMHNDCEARFQSCKAAAGCT